VGTSHTPGLVVVGAVLWLIGGRESPVPPDADVVFFLGEGCWMGWDEGGIEAP
jgi:hypothetical protein